MLAYSPSHGRAGPRRVAALATALAVLLAASLGAQAPGPLEQATELLERGQARAAEEILRRELAARPSGQGRYLLGFALLAQYRYAAAEAALRRAVESDPAQPDWLHALAKAELEQGKNRAAIATLERALALGSRADLHFARAMCRLNIGEPAAAEADLRRVLELAPSHAEARFKLGKLFFDRAEFAASRRELEACLAADPGHLEARFLLGLVAQRLGDEAGARAALETVVERVPGHVGALLNLGRLELATGETERGERMLERFRAMSSLQDEVDFLTRATEMNPDNVAGRVQLTEKLLALGRAEEALAEGLAARALAPSSAAIYRLLATVFERLGRSGDAARAREFAREVERGG